MLKVGLIGTGYIATQKHLPAWRRLRHLSEVVALCDVNQEHGRRVARQFGVPNVYKDIQQMLEKERPDIVDICTPPRTHAEVAIASLMGGAHVLIEKPMAMSTSECDSIILAAQQTNRKVCVAHSDLFYPAFLRAQEIYRQGKIGEFRGMRIFLSTPVDYMTSNSDHWANRLPGGVVGETGPHAVYLTLGFIKPVRDVICHGQKLLPQFPWSPFEDYRIDLIGENAVSSIALVYSSKQWIAQVEIWGGEGLLRIDLESQSIIHYRRRHLTPSVVATSALREAFQIVKCVLTTGVAHLAGRLKSTHELLILRFLESIRRDGTPPVTGPDGREAVRVMNSIVERLQKGTT